MTRLYVLKMTDNGPEQEEYPSEAARDAYLTKQDASFDDFYCLDVEADGSVYFYLATTGDCE